jgi:heme oxygenase (biliverdin-producing, ferredoxin)
MNNLKQLTWDVHQQAERTEFARKLLKGLTPTEYYRYLTNQYHIYTVLETAASHILSGFPDMSRAKRIKNDLTELEIMFGMGHDVSLICPVVDQYADHVSKLDDLGLVAHLYVRHFGDMYGGQMIKKRAPGSGTMYDFDDVENLKVQFRQLLNNDMVAEATACFEFATKLFEELV